MMYLVRINEYQWINPELIVYVVELSSERAELHMHGGAVLIADTLDGLNIRPVTEADPKPTTKKK